MKRKPDEEAQRARVQSHPSWDPLMSIEDAAEYLAITPRTLAKMARAGEITPVRKPTSRSHLRFRLSELNRWIRTHEAPAFGKIVTKRMRGSRSA